MKKIRKKVCWVKPWEVSEFQAWLENMAQEGWRLEDIKRGRAWFIRDKPSKIRYQCVVLDKKTQFDRVKEYQQAGWETVDQWGSVHIFRAPADSSFADNDLPSPNAFKPLLLTTLFHKLNIFGGVLPEAMVFLFLVPVVFFSPLHGPQTALSALPYLLLLLIYVVHYIARLVVDIAGVRRTARQLEQKTRLNNGTNLSRKIFWRKLAAISFFSLLATFFIVDASLSIIHGGPRPQPLPSGELAVIRAEEVYPEHDVAPALEGGSTYRVIRSIGLPGLWELEQPVRITCRDTGNEFYVTLQSSAYQTWHPGVARWLARSLASAPESLEALPMARTSDFDVLWLYHEEGVTEIVARDGRTVYHLYYTGISPPELLLSLLAERAGN